MGAWDVKREAVAGFGVEVREGALEEGVEETMGKGVGSWRYEVLGFVFFESVRE